jgi:Fe-S oxidoreductase
MPEKRLTRSNHRTEQALTNHPAIIAYVCVGLVFCIVSCFKVFGHRRRRKFSKKQLERMRDWRDGRAETKVESQIRKMKDKLKTMKQRRRLERGRDAHERLLDEAEARRDARGREVYGDDWDNPDNDGNQTASYQQSACLHCGAAPQTRSPARESLHRVR